MQSKIQALAERINNSSSSIDEPSSKLIDDLMKLVKIKAMTLSKKREFEDLTLMDLLNGFDVVVAERKPRSDIANHVYRLVLKQEREKQYTSIQDLSQEISALKLSMIEQRGYKKVNESMNNRSVTPSFLNQDLESLLVNKSPQREQSSNLKKKQLPKLNLQSLMGSAQKRNSSVPLHNHEKAIDSNRTLAFAYYTRRLLLNGWRAFYNYRLEKSNKRFLQRIGEQKFAKNTKKKVFKGFLKHAKLHPSHGKNKFRSSVIYNSKLGTKYLRIWLELARQSVQDNYKLDKAQKNLRKLRKRQILKAMKKVLLKQKLETFQGRTAYHIYRQKYLKKALLGLRYFVEFRMNLRQSNRNAKQHNKQRLLSKSLKSLQINIVMNEKLREMNRVAQQIRQFNILKLSLKQMKEYRMKRSQYKKLKQCAQNYYNLSLMKQSVDTLQKYVLLIQGLNKQKFFIDVYHQKKLKFQLFHYLMTTNFAFNEKAENFLTLKKRMYMRKILYVMKQNYRERRIHRQPQRLEFYYASYLWIQQSFAKLSDDPQLDQFSYTPFMNLSKIQHYKQMKQTADKNLHKYILLKIFRAWQGETSQIRSFINQRQDKIKRKIVRKLRVKSILKSKLKFILSQHLSKKHNKVMQEVFIRLKNRMKQKKMERMILNKYRNMKQQAKVKKVFLQLKIYFKRNLFRKNQKEAADEIFQRKLMEQPFLKWRKLFLHLSKKNNLKQTGEEYLRQKLLRNYFNRIYSTYTSLNKMASRLNQHHQKLRKRTLKKALCGFLQNILNNQHKRNLLLKAQNYHSHTLVIKSLKFWQFIMPELRQKNSLYKIIISDKQLKLKEKVFGVLKLYQNFKMKKQTTDYFMSKAVHQIRLKRFFKKWQNSLNFKTGFSLLEFVVDVARKREFFKRVERKAQFEDGVQTHMKLFNLFKMVEFTFVKGFKKNVENKYLWEENMIKVPQISKIKRKQEFLRKWREHYQRVQWEIKTVHFAIVQIKNQVIKKYFKVLNQKYQWNKHKRVVLKSKARQLKFRYFFALKKIVKSRLNCQFVHSKLTKYKRKETLRKYMNLWANELNDVMTIRNFSLNKILEFKQNILQQWHQIVKSKRNDNIKISQVKEISNYFKAKQSLRILSRYTQSKQQQQQLIEKVQIKQRRNLKSSVILSLRDYLDQNKEQIKKTAYLKKLALQRILRSKFNHWYQLFEPFLLRMRVAKCLGQMRETITIRSYIQRWLQYTEESQEIESIGERQYQMKVVQMKMEFFRKLQEQKNRNMIQRERLCTIKDYWIKKAQLKMLTTLRFATKLLQNRRGNKLRARQHYIEQLYRKSLLAFAYRASKNQQFKQLHQQFQDVLRQMKSPFVLNKLRAHALAQKECRIKTQFAEDFYVQKTCFKAFRSLYFNLICQRTRKLSLNKALVFNCDNLQRTAFNSLKYHYFKRKTLQLNRLNLTQTLSWVDQNLLMNSVFSALKENCQGEKNRVLMLRGHLVMQHMKRIINKLRSNKNHKKELKRKALLVQKKHKNRKLRGMITIWMRALNNEDKVKVMKRNQQLRIKSLILLHLQKKISHKKSINFSLLKKAHSYLNVACTAWLNYTLKQKKIRIASKQIKEAELNRLKSRSFMGLRYQTLIIRNLRVLKDKKERMLAIRSFSGWKYQIILDKTLRNYQELKYKESISSTFGHWFNLFKFYSTQKSLIGKLIVKKDNEDKVNTFIHWKKFAFGEKFVDLLQFHLTEPHQRYIASRCIQNWRRYAKYKSNKNELLQNFSEVQNSLLARRALREWYEASLNQMPARILGQRLTKITDRLLKIKALFLISEYGARNEYLANNLEELEINRNREVKRDYFNIWRKQFAVMQLQRVVQCKRQRHVARQCFVAIRDQAIQNILKQENTDKIQNYLEACTESTKLSLIKTFSKCGFKQNSRALALSYLKKLRLGAKQQKRVRLMKEQAFMFQKERIYMKYFYLMMQQFYVNNEDRQFDSQGDQVWRYKVLKKVLGALIQNTYEERKSTNARVFYNQKILFKSIQALKCQMMINRTKHALNTKMMHFLKKKCISLFKVSFTQWRIRFEHRQFKGQAVFEYHKYRNTKLKRKAFDYFVTIVQQQLQVKDMLKKAQIYFNKKYYLRKSYEVFQALKDHYIKSKEEKAEENSLEMRALRFYAKNLLIGHLKAWKNETKLNRNRQKRSKQYAVFSAWKFYTKERVLLKKYLTECTQGNQNIDPQMMSTQEMRENAARFSAVSMVKSSYGGGIDSIKSYGSTPFNKANDRILRSNGNILNSASPQYGNVNSGYRTQTNKSSSYKQRY